MPKAMQHIELGAVFGRWTVVSESYSELVNGKRRIFCQCLCSCGKQGKVRTYCLKAGASLSCGCLQHEMLSAIAYRHGAHNTPLYAVWSSMLARCRSKSHRAYKNYGARGIGVCQEWAQSFDAFKRWAESSGYAAGLALDRQDNNGNYESENCRWVTALVNNRNRRNSVYVEAFGQRKTIDEWAASAPVTRSAIARRIKMGWSSEKALTTPAYAGNSVT